MSGSSCIWTAWGEVVCHGAKEGFGVGAGPGQGPAPSPTTCATDSDCDSRSRCDNLNQNQAMWSCRPCSDIGCAIGKSCGCAPGDPTCSQSTGGSSDCAVGLSCQSSVCTAGGVVTNLNNSDYRTTPVDTDTVGRSYEAQRQAYVTMQSSGSADCAMMGTCAQGEPCDDYSLTAQCSAGLMCDAGVCKTSYGTL